MGVAPDSIMGEAISTVTEQMAKIDWMADTYSAQLSSALADIGNITIADVPVPTRLLAPSASPPQIDVGSAPSFTPATLVVPEAPTVIDIDALLSDLDIGVLEALPDAPVPAIITIPEAPALSSIALPVRPDIDTSVDLPVAPVITMPEMDALVQITLPDFVFPQLPAFNDVPPTLDSITVPDVFINWAEPVYASELLDDLTSQVSLMMAGGTGLPAPVQDALFARTRERISADTNRQVQESVDNWAARDFSMPPGMLIKQANVIREQGSLKVAEINREIMVESAKWEIENIRFAVQQGIALEQLTQNLFENMAKRLFEVAKYQAEAEINVFNAQISLFNAQNSAFETLAKVYRTKLDGAIAELTAYKTAIDGQIALGQINQQRVDVFKARLTAVQANVDVYKAMMQGASVKADTIKNQFDAYKADVQVYAEQLGAEKAKFDAYDSRVKGESAKAGVFESQTKAYASTVQAIASKSDIKLKGSQLKMEAARTRIQKFLGDVDVFKARADVNLREVQNATSVYQSQVEGWRAKVAAAVSEAEMESRFADMNVRTNIAYSEMQMSEYTARMNNAIQQANIMLEASKALGQYTAQLAAGALSAAHVSASISGSGSASSSDSTNHSTSTSYNYSY